MHNFPQFTRSSLWGEFTWVGAIIFGENVIVRRQFSWEQFSSGAIVLEPCITICTIVRKTFFRYFISSLIVNI